MKLFYKISLLILFLIGGTANPQDLLIDSYNKHDGLIQSSVADIIQDKNGMIWFYTEKGISAFDGLEFYNYIDSAGLFDSWLVASCADTSGNIYMLNLNGQVWRWDKVNFERIELPAGILNPVINISGENNLLVGTSNAGLFILKDDGWVNITREMGLYSDTINSITVINNITFAATSRGLNKLIKDKPVKLFPYEEINVQSLLLDSQNRFWLGSVNGLYLFTGNRLRKIDDTAGLIEDICEDRQNNIWIASRNGLSRIESSLNSITPNPVIPNSDFRSLLIDKEGIIWAGTIGKGVYKIRNNPFNTLTSVNQFSLQMPYPIVEDESGILWIGTNHGAVKYENNKWTVEDRLAGKLIINIFEDSDGLIWIVGSEEIYSFADGELQLICSSETLPGGMRFVSQRKNGNILIGTSRNGLWEWHNGTLQKSNLYSKMNNAVLYSSYKDSAGNVWITTNRKGVFKIIGDEVVQLDSTKGIFADYILQLDEDSKGNIWGASTGGVYVIDTNNSIILYTTEDGLASNTCYSVITQNDLAFVGTSDGMNLIDGKSIQSFTTGDGLLNNDCNTNAFYISQKNDLWIGTYEGISIINLNDLFGAKTDIGCVITKINSAQFETGLLAAGNIEEEKEVRLDSENDYLDVTCAGLYYSKPSSITYTYTLASLNDTLKFISGSKHFKLNNISPGEYSFYVEAKTPGGKPVRSINQLSIVLPHSFFQSSVFYILLIALTLLSGLLFVFVRAINRSKKLADKYKTSSLTAENYNIVREKVIGSFEIDKVYHDPELTLPKLSTRLNIHKEYISQVINNEYKKNFNEYVNSYRIEEAKELLRKNNNQKINMLSIAHEVGFNSKTTFNITFKKQTGVTPTEYKYSHDKN